MGCFGVSLPAAWGVQKQNIRTNQNRKKKLNRQQVLVLGLGHIAYNT
jgi:hypothetical protein